jgi:hypothetical protein
MLNQKKGLPSVTVLDKICSTPTVVRPARWYPSQCKPTPTMHDPWDPSGRLVEDLIMSETTTCTYVYAIQLIRGRECN